MLTEGLGGKAALGSRGKAKVEELRESKRKAL